MTNRIHKCMYLPKQLHSILHSHEQITYEIKLTNEQNHPKTLNQYLFTRMTPNASNSPRSLVVYPHLHRNSQCDSCSTVLPGDICFNCGRLCTLLVTPRPPRNSTDHRTSATQGPGRVQKKSLSQSRPFVPQYDRNQEVLSVLERFTGIGVKYRAFDYQLSEVDDLLDAKNKLAHIHTLTAGNPAIIDQRHPGRSNTRSFKPFSTSSTIYTLNSSYPQSSTLRSGTSTVSDLLGEDGKPHSHIMASWLEDVKRSSRSEARLTRRGVDCRLNMGNKVCEWVIFL